VFPDGGPRKGENVIRNRKILSLPLLREDLSVPSLLLSVRSPLSPLSPVPPLFLALCVPLELFVCSSQSTSGRLFPTYLPRAFVYLPLSLPLALPASFSSIDIAIATLIIILIILMFARSCSSANTGTFC